MKKAYLKGLTVMGIILSTAFLLILLPIVVGAQPTKPPAEGNVDANFNSVSIKDGSDTNLMLQSDGKITNPTSDAVFIQDEQGLIVRASDPASGIVVSNPDGGITVDAANGGITVDAANGGITVNTYDGGLTVNARGYGGFELNTLTGGIVNNNVYGFPFFTGYPVRVTDPQGLDVSGKLTVNDYVFVDGPVRARGGFGEVYTKVGSYGTINPGGYRFTSISCDNANHRILDCGVRHGQWGLVNDGVTRSENSCNISMYNMSGLVTSLAPEAICWNPNGYW